MKFELLPEVEAYRDPIHGYVYVEYKIINDLIRTKEVQRLKRIHQLGGTLQVFPTAEHSRFSHSLGTYEIVRTILNNSKTIKDSLNEEEQVTLLCAALLHDIGHGPFSHAFEMIHPVHHELYSAAIIRGDSEINGVLSAIDPKLADKVALVIEKKHPNPILTQLISSQLDADRMDYMLRDAYFTGTTYGYIDIGRLFRGLLIDKGRIVYKESNVSNIENIVMGRYHMYTQVYYHPASYCYEIIIMNLLKRYFELAKAGYHLKNNYKYLWPFAEGKPVTVSEYTNLDDTVIYFYIRCFCEEDDPILKDLGDRALNRHLFKYKYVKCESELEEIKNKVIAAGYDPAYYFYYGRLTQHVYKKYGKNDTSSILIKLRDGEVKELTQVSSIVKAVTKESVAENGDIIAVYLV